MLFFRFSTSEKGGFAFTVAERNGKITHYRVSRDWSKPRADYILRMKPEDRTYASLAALLEGARKELRLRIPLGGSKLYLKVLPLVAACTTAFSENIT